MRALHKWQAAGIAMILSVPAVAQQPTQAQAGAIRSACRGDYQTYCASVPTGGQAALQCLQQNAGSVSAGCQQALSAVGGGGAAPAQGGGQSMGAPMGQPMGQAAPPPIAAPRPPMRRPIPPPPPPPPRMSPREEMAVLRGSCGYDFRRFCRGVQLGGGRGLACLKAYGPSLTPQCQSALLSMKGSR
jgi:hypothetical protein